MNLNLDKKVDIKQDINMTTSFDKLPAEYKEDIEKATRLLIDSGCKEVFLFGSLAEGTATEGSDIDLAVRGCPPQKFYAILGKLLMELKHSVDLVDLDNSPSLSNFLTNKGGLLNVIK